MIIKLFKYFKMIACKGFQRSGQLYFKKILWKTIDAYLCTPKHGSGWKYLVLILWFCSSVGRASRFFSGRVLGSSQNNLVMQFFFYGFVAQLVEYPASLAGGSFGFESK